MTSISDKLFKLFLNKKIMSHAEVITSERSAAKIQDMLLLGPVPRFSLGDVFAMGADRAVYIVTEIEFHINSKTDQPMGHCYSLKSMKAPFEYISSATSFLPESKTFQFLRKGTSAELNWLKAKTASSKCY